MPLKIVRGKTLPIGVDIGSNSLKLAQLRVTEGNYELLAACDVEMPRNIRKDPSERLRFVSQNLREMQKNHTFKSKQCIISIPAEATFVQHVKLPRLGPDATEQALQAELSGRLPYNVSDAILQHVVVADQLPGEGDPMQEVIAVAAPKDLIHAYLAAVEQAKLQVLGINVEPCAVVECFSRLFRRDSDSSRTIFFVDIGAESTQVAFAHGNRIVFARNLKIGGDDFDRAIAEGMGQSVEDIRKLRSETLQNEESDDSRSQLALFMREPVETVATELSKCLRYYESTFRNRAIERMIFLGGQAYDKALCQSLAEGLNIPAQIGDPLLRVGRSDALGKDRALNQREPLPEWAVAVGLSIGSITAA